MHTAGERRVQDDDVKNKIERIDFTINEIQQNLSELNFCLLANLKVLVLLSLRVRKDKH